MGATPTLKIRQMKTYLQQIYTVIYKVVTQLQHEKIEEEAHIKHSLVFDKMKLIS